MRIDIDIQTKGIDDLIRKLNPNITKKAINRTINDLGNKISTLLVKEVRQTYNIKAKDLKQFIKVKKSNYGNLEYYMDVRSRPLNITRFGARKLKAKGQISVKVKNETGRANLVPAFFSNKKGNAVLTRKKNTQEIKSVTTLSIPQMFNEKILDKAKDMVGNEYDRIFKKNFDFYIGKK